MTTTTLAKSPRETSRAYAVRVFRHLREQGAPVVVTADEAHRLAEPFGVDAGRKGDHSTPYNLSTLSLRIARLQQR